MGDTVRWYKKRTSLIRNWFFWQGQKDSNPQQRFWRPTCYHYTMPLRGTFAIIAKLGAYVNKKFAYTDDFYEHMQTYAQGW